MTKSHPQTLKLEEFLPYRVSVLSNTISGIIAATYQDKFKLSVTEWRIMAVLGEYPSSSADEVSSTIHTEKSIISRSLKRLLERRFVQREVNTSDRRRQDLTLTGLGWDVYKQIVPVSYEYETALLACFSKTEQKHFNGLLDRLYAHARQMEGE